MVIPGQRAGSEFCSHKKHIPLGLPFQLHSRRHDGNKDFSLSSAAGSGHPHPGTRQRSLGLFQLSRVDPFPSVCQLGAVSKSQNSMPPPPNQGYIQQMPWVSTGSLTLNGVWHYLRSWTQTVKHALCIFEINEASFAYDMDGWIFGSAEHLQLLPHSLRARWHAALWKIRPCFFSAKGLLMCGISNV